MGIPWKGSTPAFKRLAWEGTRWVSPGMLLALALLWAVLLLLDACSDIFFISEWQSGALNGSATQYILCSVSRLQIAGLCCSIFAGAGLYAQDYGENAVYMRIQRMGARQYAGLRTLQASAGSWLVGCAGTLLAVLLASLALQVPLFPQDPGRVESWSPSRLLQAGQNIQFLAWMSMMAGFRSMFYAVATLAFSFFVPRRQVLLALPMLLWYFNQYALVWVEWIPFWLQPGTALTPGIVSLAGGVPEWGILGLAAIGLTCLAVAVWALFVLRLRRAGTFGGEQIE